MRNKIIGFYVFMVALAVLTVEIWLIREVAESKHQEAIAAIQQPPRIAVIESAKPKKWNDVYLFVKSRNHRVFPKLSEMIADGVVKYSEKYNVNPDIVISLMAVESNFNYATVSNKDAIGLMQVVYKYWKDDPEFKEIIRKEHELFDPELNIQAGCYILSVLKERNKNDRRKYLNAYYGAAGHYERVMNIYGYYKIETEES